MPTWSHVSHLWSLHQKKEQLAAEIRIAADNFHTNVNPSTSDASATDLFNQPYFLDLLPHGDTHVPPKPAFLGPGTSARLLESLLKSCISWYIANDADIPKGLLSHERGQQMREPRTASVSALAVANEQRKVELHSLLPPSTQRAIIEHYLNIVSVEYPLLPFGRESDLLTNENPLRLSSSEKDTPSSFAMIIVFAISSTMMARDLEPALFAVSTRCTDDVHMISQKLSSGEDQLESTRWACTALCALALCEMIRASSGQLWDLLGRACATIEDLREEYQLSNMRVDDDFRRLERSLFKLESMAALHFSRPSTFCTMRLDPSLELFSGSGPVSGELKALYHLHLIAGQRSNPPRTPEAIESLVPFEWRQPSGASTKIIHAAMLYVALSPLLATLDSMPSTSTDPAPYKLLETVARAAATLIQHISHLNQENKIMSLWMTAETVLEAGLMWVTFLVAQRRFSPAKSPAVIYTGSENSMRPLLGVSSLLASFVARWRSGAAYVEVWETLMELIWNMV